MVFEEKQYAVEEKVKSPKTMTDEEKMQLWMPKGMTTPAKAGSSRSNSISSHHSYTQQ